MELEKKSSKGGGRGKIPPVVRAREDKSLYSSMYSTKVGRFSFCSRIHNDVGGGGGVVKTVEILFYTNNIILLIRHFRLRRAILYSRTPL